MNITNGVRKWSISSNNRLQINSLYLVSLFCTGLFICILKSRIYVMGHSGESTPCRLIHTSHVIGHVSSCLYLSMSCLLFFDKSKSSSLTRLTINDNDKHRWKRLHSQRFNWLILFAQKINHQRSGSIERRKVNRFFSTRKISSYSWSRPILDLIRSRKWKVPFSFWQIHRSD